jgi:hypothetical protein
MIIRTGFILLLLGSSTLLARDFGQYAQGDPAIGRWFREQRSPKTHIPCCSEADGTKAREDIRGEHYWTRFIAAQTQIYDAESGRMLPGEEVDSDWMEVPDDVVIHGPNLNGAPTVWYFFENGALKIRCYSPGPGT